jgi:U3 small nucleolar RNA-associated protein 20
LFGDALDSWKELNCTTHFAQFCYAVQPKTASLAQILHFKTELVDILCEHLTITDSLALEPLLEYYFSRNY